MNFGTVCSTAFFLGLGLAAGTAFGWPMGIFMVVVTAAAFYLAYAE